MINEGKEMLLALARNSQTEAAIERSKPTNQTVETEMIQNPRKTDSKCSR